MMNGYVKNYTRISPATARKLLMSTPGILLIDVRNPEECASGYIPGSINMPLQYLQWGIRNLPVGPYTPIITYCQAGMRAASAATLLVQTGFQNVYTFGGIENWPYEIVKNTWR
ncbi:MAG: rhodanese-like domain-containing protein [Bacillota bacterium]|nr:rhodanese-like domain-containing protein [Bacillota bacterium]